MWNENDNLMQLVDDMGQAKLPSPAKCPVCGKEGVHYLMHRFEEPKGRGSAWLWCGECGSYTHFSYFVPDWWENPKFIDAEKLDSFVDYPADHAEELDAWNSELLKRANRLRRKC